MELRFPPPFSHRILFSLADSFGYGCWEGGAGARTGPVVDCKTRRGVSQDTQTITALPCMCGFHACGFNLRWLQEEEREDVKNIDRRAKLRIATQLGIDVSRVNKFINGFEEMKGAPLRFCFIRSCPFRSSSLRLLPTSCRSSP